jgi:histone H3/H4
MNLARVWNHHDDDDLRMTRIKSFVGTRKPDASGSVKTPRKAGLGIAPKGILKKTGAPKVATAAPAKAKKAVRVSHEAGEETNTKKGKTSTKKTATKKKKQQQHKEQQRAPVHEDEEDVGPVLDDDDDDDAEPLSANREDVVGDDDDDAVSTEDDNDDNNAVATTKPRKINYALRRLKRMKTLQKSEARLCTESGFKKLVRFVLGNSTTAALGLDSVRFTRAALQNLQAAVESLLQLILSDTAQQVYTITGRNARVSAAPIATTAEQRLRSMNGAQFINDYRDVCSM